MLTVDRLENKSKELEIKLKGNQSENPYGLLILDNKGYERFHKFIEGEEVWGRFGVSDIVGVIRGALYDYIIRNTNVDDLDVKWVNKEEVKSFGDLVCFYGSSNED